MERLNFKKVGSGLLMLAIMSGCTTNTPVNKAVTPDGKSGAIKAAEVKTIDLGSVDGGSVKVNFRFADKQKFRLKNDYPTNTSGPFPLTNYTINIKLYRTSVGGSGLTPKARYDAANAVGNGTGNVFQFPIVSPAASNVVTFKGLKGGYDYYMSARMYTPMYDLTPSNIKVDLAGTSVSNSTPDLSGLGLYSTDQVKINNFVADVDTPPGSPFTSFTVNPAIAGGAGVSFTNFARNVVGIGNIGDTTASQLGMAADTAQVGGGTAPAYTGSASGGTAEEYITFFTGTSSINIANDDTPGLGVATPNFTWDMEINMMESLGADIDGNVKVNLGGMGPMKRYNRTSLI